MKTAAMKPGPTPTALVECLPPEHRELAIEAITSDANAVNVLRDVHIGALSWVEAVAELERRSGGREGL